MEPTKIDTADVPPAEQYQWYTEQLDKIFGIKSAPVSIFSGPYRGRIGVLSLPPLTYLTFDAENNGGVRMARQISRVEWGHYCVYREKGAGILFELAGRDITTSPGDIVIYDGDAPMRSRAKEAFRHDIWMVPRAAIDPHLPWLPRPLVVHIPGSMGVAPLIHAYAEALAAPLPSFSQAEAALVADNLGRLVAIACGATARPHGDAVRVAKLDQARRYIDRHLTEPGLDPQNTAAALCISIRQLHLLFESSHETFGQYVRRRRLQECRATLESPLSAGRSISDIALGWGFASLPTFYRAFQTAYGIAPSDLRFGMIDR